MDVPNTEDVSPQGSQRRTFWESRADMQSNFMHGTYDEYQFDGNESSEMPHIINNDSSDSECRSYILFFFTCHKSSRLLKNCYRFHTEPGKPGKPGK